MNTQHTPINPIYYQKFLQDQNIIDQSSSSYIHLTTQTITEKSFKESVEESTDNQQYLNLIMNLHCRLIEEMQIRKKLEDKVQSLELLLKSNKDELVQLKEFNRKLIIENNHLKEINKQLNKKNEEYQSQQQQTNLIMNKSDNSIVQSCKQQKTNFYFSSRPCSPIAMMRLSTPLKWDTKQMSVQKSQITNSSTITSQREMRLNSAYRQTIEQLVRTLSKQKNNNINSNKRKL